MEKNASEMAKVLSLNINFWFFQLKTLIQPTATLRCYQNAWVLLWGRSEEMKVIVSLHLLLSYRQPHDI